MDVSRKCYELLSLEGKAAVVTGGASGIGRGVAKRLAELGAKIAVLDIDEPKGAETAAEIKNAGGEAVFIKCDVSQSRECRTAAEKVADAFGRIDILVNNAGIAVRKTVLELEPEEWDSALNISLKGQYLMAKFVIPHMKKCGGGSIINMGSGWSFRGGERAASYCAAKGGTLNMTRAMCIDHGKDNIRVNTVCPGDIDTPMLQSECRQLNREYDETFKAECADRPLARIGTPEDVADAAAFLAGHMARWITGACLVVDGGGTA